MIQGTVISNRNTSANVCGGSSDCDDRSVEFLAGDELPPVDHCDIGACRPESAEASLVSAAAAIVVVAAAPDAADEEYADVSGGDVDVFEAGPE